MASRSIARSDLGTEPPPHDDARLAAATGRPPLLSVRQKLRVARRVAALLGVLLPCLIGHGLWRLLRASSPWPRLFLGGAARAVGTRVKTTGTPIKRNVVFLSNHVSFIDILAIAGATGTAFVAKDGIRTAPVVGWLASLNDTVYVTREDRGGIGEQIERLRASLANRWSVTIFPEGTTDDGRSLLPFKSSLLKILEPAPPGVVVQPLLLDYGEHGPDIAWLGAESGLHNALRVLARAGPVALTIHFLEPFDPAIVVGRKAIAAEARLRIARMLSERLGYPAPDFIGHDVWQRGEVARVPMAAL